MQGAASVLEFRAEWLPERLWHTQELRPVASSTGRIPVSSRDPVASISDTRPLHNGKSYPRTVLPARPFMRHFRSPSNIECRACREPQPLVIQWRVDNDVRFKLFLTFFRWDMSSHGAVSRNVAFLEDFYRADFDKSFESRLRWEFLAWAEEFHSCSAKSDSGSETLLSNTGTARHSKLVLKARPT